MAQLITIQERGEIEGGWQAVVRFNKKMLLKMLEEWEKGQTVDAEKKE